MRCFGRLCGLFVILFGLLHCCALLGVYGVFGLRVAGLLIRLLEGGGPLVER